GLERIAAVAHAGESLLSRLRDGRRTATPDVATALLQLGDALGRSMRSLEEGRESDGEDRRHLVERLTALASGGDAPAAAQTAASGAGAESSAGPADDSIRVGVDLLEKLMNLADELVLVRN